MHWTDANRPPIKKVSRPGSMVRPILNRVSEKQIDIDLFLCYYSMLYQGLLALERG